MSGIAVSENDQIAKIYERMMGGDKEALANLKHPSKYAEIRKKQESNIKQSNITQHQKEQIHQNLQSKDGNQQKEEKIIQSSKKIVSHSSEKIKKTENIDGKINKVQQNQTKANKNSNLRAAIKQKMQEFQQSKPFNKKFTSNREVVSQNSKGGGEDNKNLFAKLSGNDFKKQLEENLANLKPPTKTKDAFNKKLEKNIIKDSDRTQETPSSKHSFRIKKKLPSNSNHKQQRQSLMKINEQERAMQNQILEFHNQTKDELQSIKKEYKLNFSNFSKYIPNQINHEINEDNGPLSPIQIQNQKYAQCQSAIQKINALLSQKKSQIKKIESKISQNPFIQYLKNCPQDIFEARQSEQQADQVQELPSNIPINNAEGQKAMYSNLMPSIKDKKYGLNLRRTYDVFKSDTNIVEPKEKDVLQTKVSHEQNGQNKVIVNSRLKELLFS